MVYSYEEWEEELREDMENIINLGITIERVTCDGLRNILRALPDMFHYLDNPNIPKTTNGFRIRLVGPEYNNYFSKKYQLFFASLPGKL
jgi:hypothetical protein